PPPLRSRQHHPPDRPVDRDQPGTGFGPSCREPILRRELSALRVEHLEEVRAAFLEAQSCEIRRTLACGCGILQVAQSVARLLVVSHRRTHLCLRAKYGQLVLCRRLTQMRTRFIDAGLDATDIEQRQRYDGPDRVTRSAAVPKSVELARGVACDASD